MWIVKLIKPPTVNDFRHDFFPRRFRYKTDALELQAEVAHKGGETVIERMTTSYKTRLPVDAD